MIPGIGSGSDESDTPRDGVLSYPAEWHALAHGVYLGFTTKPKRTPPVPQRDDVDKEMHYYRGGYILGSLLQIALVGGSAVGLGMGLGVV